MDFSPSSSRFLLLFLFLSLTFLSPAAIINVPGDYSTIQPAINAATNGDEIIVSPGTYVENLSFNGKNIILRSTEPTNPSVVETTVIDGNQSGSVVTFAGSENESCILSGFTITNGRAILGGGIRGNDTLATIRHNRVTTNSAYWTEWPCDSGAGLSDCQGIVHHNTISDNSCNSYGGALYQCHGIVRNNVIARNTAGQGGALAFSHGIIQNNTIYKNSASQAGGLFECHGTLVNCTIWGNTWGEGGGLHYCRGFIVNCILWGNYGYQHYAGSPPLYSCVQGGVFFGGKGNISSDPRFVNPEAGDFHLLPDSPCIDAAYLYYLAADAFADLDGESRLQGSSVDMGCDEFDSQPDHDADLLADVNEPGQGADPYDPDTDNDGLLDGIEMLRGTNPTIPDALTTLSIPAQFPSIQEALFLARPSERLVVSPGTYYENLHLLRKSLTLQSTDPLNDAIVGSTVIDGDGTNIHYPVIFLSGTETETCLLTGLTIRHGDGLYRGGALRGNRSLATIERNRIEENEAARGGGLYECDGLIQLNTISGNSALRGGAFDQCHGLIQHNTIFANSALWWGAGFHFCHGIIQNNTVFSNTAQGDDSSHGGGFSSCHGIIQNNLITDNLGRYGGGLHGCLGDIRNNTIYRNTALESGSGLHACEGTVKNCIVWANTSPYAPFSQIGGYAYPQYCCIEAWTGGGVGNITDDPLLADPASGDFHLLPTSPCIDAGGFVELAQDFEGDARPYEAIIWEYRGDGSHFDIGADEFVGSVPTPTPTPITFDFETGPQGWTFRTPSPAEYHLSHWDHATSTISSSAIGISSPYDESTNYFALWDSFDAEAIPYYDNALYHSDWLFSTNRESTNCVPSLRFRIGLKNHKAFACCRLYPDDWLPLARVPNTTFFSLFFEPPIASPEGLYLAFSLIDWTDDFRQSSPAGEIYLEEVSVYRHDLSEFTDWQELLSLNPGDFTTWLSSTAPPYDAPAFARDDDGLHLSSTIDNSLVFGAWDSPPGLFTLAPPDLYRLTSNVSSNPPLGGPDLRLRVHTDDFRYSWYTSYVSSYTAEETALPASQGSDYALYLMLPFATQPCRFSFDLMDFSSTLGGTLSLHHLSLHSHSF